MAEKLIGTLFIVSAPSGAGKTSLVNALVGGTNHLKLSISATTRKARPGEIDGQHYHFINQKEFKQKIATKDFLEYAEVFGNFYGTSQESVDKMLQDGHDVILEIDWQGAQQTKKRRADAISIFILPPSIQELRTRLENRGQDSKETIDARMQKSINEISHYDKTDYLVINDDFEKALDGLKTIINAYRLQTSKQAIINADILTRLLQ